VDASGNGSLTLEFLKSIGRRPPVETTLGVNIRYASALFERSPIWNDYKTVSSLPSARGQTRGGLIVPAENNRNQVVLSGRGKDDSTGSFVSRSRAIGRNRLTVSATLLKRQPYRFGIIGISEEQTIPSLSRPHHFHKQCHFHKLWRAYR
jgi:hypothetical protein